MTRRSSPSSQPHLWFAYASEPRGEHGCLEWTGAKTEGGYGKLHDGSNRTVHVAIWEALYGPVPDGFIVMHATCDNPPCFRPNHLALGTHRQNQRQKWDRGRGGARQKIDPAAAHEIRRLYSTGTILQRELAERYGVVQTQISKIINGKSWRD